MPKSYPNVQTTLNYDQGYANKAKKSSKLHFLKLPSYDLYRSSLDPQGVSNIHLNAEQETGPQMSFLQRASMMQRPHYLVPFGEKNMQTTVDLNQAPIVKQNYEAAPKPTYTQPPAPPAPPAKMRPVKRGGGSGLRGLFISAFAVYALFRITCTDCK